MSRYVQNATYTPSQNLQNARADLTRAQRSVTYERSVLRNGGRPPARTPGQRTTTGRPNADAATGLSEIWTPTAIDKGLEWLGYGTPQERAQARVQEAEAAMAAQQTRVNNLEQAEARKAGSKEHWLDEQRAAKKKYEAEVAGCADEKCRQDAADKYARNKWGTRLPNSGTWDGEPGNSKWRPKPGSEAAQALSEYGKDGIDYRKGHPNFEPFQYKKTSSYLGGTRTPGAILEKRGVVDVHNMTGVSTGKNGDFAKANQAMGNGFNHRSDARGYTWHHNKNGVTMELVDSRIHNTVFNKKATGGAVHTGGASYLRLQTKDPARF